MMVFNYKSIVLDECKYYVFLVIKVIYLQYITDKICGARFQNSDARNPLQAAEDSAMKGLERARMAIGVPINSRGLHRTCT